MCSIQDFINSGMGGESMEVEDYLKKVAYVGPSEIANDNSKVYYSNFDNSYITRVGMEKSIQFLADREITEQLTHGVGFSPKNGKWYGWSHRAVYGFTIGSKVKMGDCGFVPSNVTEMIEDLKRWYSDNMYKNLQLTPQEDGVKIQYESGSLGYDSVEPFPKWGRGEWEAKTMDDARQMAIDFNKGVS